MWWPAPELILRSLTFSVGGRSGLPSIPCGLLFFQHYCASQTCTHADTYACMYSCVQAIFSEMPDVLQIQTWAYIFGYWHDFLLEICSFIGLNITITDMLSTVAENKLCRSINLKDDDLFHLHLGNVPSCTCPCPGVITAPLTQWLHLPFLHLFSDSLSFHNISCCLPDSHLLNPPSGIKFVFIPPACLPLHLQVP